MADQRSARQIVALALLSSAIVLGAVAYLIYVDTIPAPRLAAYIVGLAAGLDFLLGLAFFRMGQSS